MPTIAIGVSKAPGGGYTCRVPLSAVSESGVPPEEGDTVQYSVEGTVQSVSGNDATIKIESVNGEPISEEGAESPEEEGAEPETGTEGAAGGGAGGGAGGAGESLADMRKRLMRESKGLPM